MTYPGRVKNGAVVFDHCVKLPEGAEVKVDLLINCLDCGFCVVECFPCRRFDRETKTLRIDGCIACGNCLRLKFCMGWRHRFWRRIIVEEDGNG